VYDIHGGDHRGGKGRGEIGGVYLALSAGSYNTTLLVMVTLSPPLVLCPNKIFRHGKKILFPLFTVCLTPFNNILKALIFF
jgi:hypothetical protein